MAINWGGVLSGAMGGAATGGGGWGSVAGGVLGGLGGMFGGDSASAAEEAAIAAQQELLRRAVYTPFNFYGPGGQYAQAGARFVQPQAAPGTVTTQPVGGPSNFMPAAAGGGGGGVPAGVQMPQFGSGRKGQRKAAKWTQRQAADQWQGSPHDIEVQLGDLEPVRSGLVGMAGQQLGQAALQGLPPGVAQAAQATQGIGPQSLYYDPYTLAALQGQAGGAGSLAYSGLFQPQNPLANLLQNQAYAGAIGQAGIAGQDPAAVQAQVLEQLRAQAKPQEEQATQAMFNRLFSTGALGTSGGASIAGQLSQAQHRPTWGASWLP